MIEQTSDDNALAECAEGKEKCRRHKDPFPPELERWQKVILRAADIALVVSAVALIYFFLSALGALNFLHPPLNIGLLYLGFGIVLAGLFLDRIFRHKSVVHKARLEDRSEVEASIVEARNVEPRLADPKRPVEYEQKRNELSEEFGELMKIGPDGWTEYQVLSLNQMVVDFLKLDDLRARARSSLAELQEYAEDSAYRYDILQYSKWDERIKKAEKEIDEIEQSEDSALRKDDAAEMLRAELRTLLDHVADYQANWAEGSAIIRNLMICCAVAVPALLIAGILPVLYPSDDRTLRVLHWGLLGISGSLTAVLLGLRKSDLVEVGNTVGKKELWRAVLGATLGFVAGVLIYSIIRGGLLADGAAVPNLTSAEPDEASLSVLWAVASGFSFERIFERMRIATDFER